MVWTAGIVKMADADLFTLIQANLTLTRKIFKAIPRILTIAKNINLEAIRTCVKCVNMIKIAEDIIVGLDIQHKTENLQLISLI